MALKGRTHEDPSSPGRGCGRGALTIRLTGAITLAILAVAALPAAEAAQLEYFISGRVRSTTFSALPVGTQFTGAYQLDDATVDSDASADVGVYATGRFEIDFGSGIGRIVFDQAPQIRVANDIEGFFGVLEDTFTLSAGVGSRDTPGFSNEVQGRPAVLFRVSAFPPDAPSALVDDSLTGVPHVAGAPWSPDDQVISITVSAVGGGCGPFATHCTATLAVEQVAQLFPLSVTRTGQGSGQVLSQPEGIDCGASCSADLGGTVTLTADADPNSTFVGWTGCDSVDGSTCTVFMDGPRTVEAEFQPTPQVPMLSPGPRALLAVLMGLAGLWLLAITRRGAA